MASSSVHFHQCTHLASRWDCGYNRRLYSCKPGLVKHIVESRIAIDVDHVVTQRLECSVAPSPQTCKLRCEALRYDSAKVSLTELVHRRRRQFHQKQHQQDAAEKRNISAGNIDEPLLHSEADSVSRKADIAEEISSLDLRLNRGQMDYELEEAKVLLSEYLKKDHAAASVSLIVSKATRFLVHLVFLMHWHYHIKHLSRRELTTMEIRVTLRFYLESLGAEHGSNFIVYILSFPSALPPQSENSTPPPQGEAIDPLQRIDKHDLNPVKKKRIPKLEQISDATLFPSLVYVSSLGMTQEQLATLLRRCPQFVHYKVEENIKPVISFCLSLGVQPSQIPGIVLKRPQLFRCEVNTNLQQKLNHLQALGVEAQRFSKILVYFPHMLTYRQQKVSSAYNFLIRIGLSPDEAGEVLARFPHVVGYSIPLKLEPVASYLSALGINQVSAIIVRSPQTLGLSLEDKIKPAIAFFLSRGFSKEEVIRIVVRFPQILGLNLNKNLQRKWEFFCQTDCSMSEIVKFPQYFGYSLDKRIIPRYKILVANNLKWGLNTLLSNSESKFLGMVKAAVFNARKSVAINQTLETKKIATKN